MKTEANYSQNVCWSCDNLKYPTWVVSRNLFFRCTQQQQQQQQQQQEFQVRDGYE